MNPINFINYGQEDGDPIIVLHGFPGSCVHGMFFRHFALERGVEILSLDRPGYGETPLSTFSGVDGWIELMRNFLRHQKLDRFSVIGISGGTPFAVAIAHAFPQQVKRLGIICGLAPWHESKKGFSLSQNLGFMFYKNALQCSKNNTCVVIVFKNCRPA